MTFKQFQASRRLCTDKEAHSWEGDIERDPRYGGQPRFHYKFDNGVHVSILIGDAHFDIQVQGYPHLDCFESLDDAERALWNHAMSEDWGIT